MEQLSEKLLNTLKSCTNLPSPPAIATRIIDLSTSVTAGLGDVADIISIDPALSAKLLRMANSPLYTKQRKIENLRQAITLFGLDGTLNIALSFSLSSSSIQDDSSGLNYNNYWKRSLASAILSQNLAEHLGEVSRDSAFLAGLLQDIGMLALDKAKPDLYLPIKDAQLLHEDIFKLELDVINTDHSAVGAWMLQEWRLPDHLIGPIYQSHHIFNGGNACQNCLAKAVACSSVLADIFLAETENMNELIANCISRARSIVDLNNQTFHNIIESASENFTDLELMFDFSFDTPCALECISEQAKEVLILRNLHKIKETECLQETTRKLESKAEALEELNRRDALTQLFNRRYFDESIDVEFKNARKYQWPLGLIFIDIDHFKQINDTYGHDAGDEVLRQVSDILMHCTRNSDIVSRYGGEEFTIILPGTSQEGVEITCDRIINAFRNSTMNLEGGEIVHVTASAGACVYDGKNEDIKDCYDLVKYSDQATYICKNKGRNQFYIVADKSALQEDKLAS